MSEDKDELLKQQNEEIQKLKKELKSATKPSSMLSVLKNSIKRNVHDFFVREDRMKTMDSKIKKLEKELEQKEDELNKTSAELFAAVNLGQPEAEPETPPSSDTEKVDDADCRTETAPVFPQTAEEAIKEYFGPINLAELARHYYPDANQVSHSPTEPSSIPLKPEPEVEKPKSEDSKESIGSSQPEKEDKPERHTEQKSEPNAAPPIVAETKKTESAKKEIQKESLEPEITKEIKKESTKSESQKPQNSQPVAEKNIKQQSDNQQNRQADRATATVVDKNGKKKSKKDKRKGNQNRQMVEEPKTQEEMTEKTKTDTQENAKEEKTASAQKSPEKMKSQADKAPTSKQVTLAEPKEHIVVPIIEPPAEPEVEPPEDFGGVVVFEEPSIDDLPDIGNINSDENSQNVFTDMFDEDWDDSAVV